ncbi:MAG: hypothetical protein PHI22_01585 [Bacilli bacterium]|nr:hypothetical protein [Bacilli bacterium]MDD4298178.1 hypothetical protein [Bacilli bacterium]MDD4643424.1 hypothetical protein [Bacilli bacterium]
MKKKLPDLYVNKIEKKIVNNDTVFYSALEYKTKERNDYIDISETNTKDVKEKIDEMFSSPNYVYKMSTIITLKDKSIIHKDIIGMMNNKLITIDEESIDINDIRDIRF